MDAKEAEVERIREENALWPYLVKAKAALAAKDAEIECLTRGLKSLHITVDDDTKSLLAANDEIVRLLAESKAVRYVISRCKKCTERWQIICANEFVVHGPE